MSTCRCTYPLIMMLLVPLIPLSVAASASPSPSALPVPKKRMKPASELIGAQEPVKINSTVLEKAPGEPLAVLVSLSRQRAYLLVGGKIAVTPKGEFAVLEKDPYHQSTLDGNFVDGGGRVVRAGVSSKLDAAPSGTRFRGAPMKFFMRLTPQGVGMHVGILPGYPASHGCIRMPLEAAQIIYNKVGINTPVTVAE